MHAPLVSASGLSCVCQHVQTCEISVRLGYVTFKNTCRNACNNVVKIHVTVHGYIVTVRSVDIYIRLILSIIYIYILMRIYYINPFVGLLTGCQ